jgi:hypothetical protein
VNSLSGLDVGTAITIFMLGWTMGVAFIGARVLDGAQRIACTAALVAGVALMVWVLA